MTKVNVLRSHKKMYPIGTVILKQITGRGCKFVITGDSYSESHNGQPCIALDFTHEMGVNDREENKVGIGGFTILPNEHFAPEKLNRFLADWEVKKDYEARLQQEALAKKKRCIAMGKQLIPAGVTYAIVAQIKDENAPSTSYDETPLTFIILEWSTNDRKNPAELRKAAARFEPTLHLAEENEDKVHPHSGYYRLYLAEYSYSYPRVYKIRINAFLEELCQTAADPEKFLVNREAAAPYLVRPTSYKPRVSYNSEERTLELYFYHHLPAVSEQQLMEKGWKYFSNRYCYYAPFSAETLAFANTFEALAVEP